FASSECMNPLRTAPSTVLRNSVRGIRNAWTLTPPAYSARLAVSTFLSSIVTSARSMSDFAQTVSCDRLPQRMAARIDRSCFTCATRSSSAWVNFLWMGSVDVLTLPASFCAPGAPGAPPVETYYLPDGQAVDGHDWPKATRRIPRARHR